MTYDVRQMPHTAFPPLLQESPEPPEKLWYAGELPNYALQYLAVVGSRKISTYGKLVIEHLIGGLSGYPVCIVSGLALGVDGYALKEALRVGLKTIAVPGSGLDPRVLYPRAHYNLAQQIITSGGTLLSEYEPSFRATEWSFPKRNRIMAGMCHATLVVEASEKSGTLITARLAADYNRELLVVPGNIFSENSKGVHQFLKLGATPVTEPGDILDALGIKQVIDTENAPAKNFESCTPDEQAILRALKEPLSREELFLRCGLNQQTFSVTLSLLELNNIVTDRNGTIVLKV